MKLNKIAALFKRNKHLTIYNTENGEQWISNGYAIYSMRGLPQVTPTTVLRLFDVPSNKHKGWTCKAEDLPEFVIVQDSISDEINIEPYKLTLQQADNRYWIFSYGAEIHAINEDYLNPLLNGEYITFHKRKDNDGNFMLAIKDGLELIAIVMPMLPYKTDEFIKEINAIAGLFTHAAESANMHVNRDTGEVTTSEGRE